MSAVMIAAILATVAQASLQPTGGREARLMLAGDVDGTLAEYERLCLHAPFDRAAHDRAIAASSWRFRPVEVEGENASGHMAQRGYAYFRGPDSAGGLQQCNLDAALERAIDPAALTARIGGLLQGRLPMFDRIETRGQVYWQWPAEPGWVVRLYWMRPAGSDPRQLTLSLQKWPSNLAGVPDNSDEGAE